MSGAVSRPVWGWVADRLLTPARTLALHGIGMALASIGAGSWSSGWTLGAVVAVAILGGATASGFTGVAYAEFAALGGARRTEATGLGTAAMFTGVMVIPSCFGLAVTRFGGFFLPYAGLAVAALGATALLAAQRHASFKDR